MRVFARMVGHELRLMRSDRALLATLVVLAAAVAYGVANGSGWVAFQRGVLGTLAREEAGRLDALRARAEASEDGVPADQVGAGLGVRVAGLPPGPLAALVVGQSDLEPYHAVVTTATRAPGSAAATGDEIENPAHLLSGRFDLGFVVVSLFPLVILALGYNLLSSEKEQGTLVLILTQPVRLAGLVGAKVAARGLAALGLAVVLAGAGFALAGGRVSDGDGLARLGLWVLVVAAYGAFWFALAVAVNALGRGSATNALALAGTWLLVVAIVPALANVAVRAAHPVPSRVELVQAVRAASDRAQAEGPRLNRKFLEAHPELTQGRAEASEFAVQTLAVQEATEAGVAGVLARFDAQLARQQALVDRFRFASPAIAALEALQDVAGTGPARSRRFADQVAAFHDQWRRFFRPRILANEPIRAADLDLLPAFAFQEEPTRAVAGRVAVALVGLVVPTLLVAALGRIALRRYPVVG